MSSVLTCKQRNMIYLHSWHVIPVLFKYHISRVKGKIMLFNHIALITIRHSMTTVEVSKNRFSTLIN